MQKYKYYVYIYIYVTCHISLNNTKTCELPSILSKKGGRTSQAPFIQNRMKSHHHHVHQHASRCITKLGSQTEAPLRGTWHENIPNSTWEVELLNINRPFTAKKGGAFQLSIQKRTSTKFKALFVFWILKTFDSYFVHGFSGRENAGVALFTLGFGRGNITWKKVVSFVEGTGCLVSFSSLGWTRNEWQGFQTGWRLTSTFWGFKMPRLHPGRGFASQASICTHLLNKIIKKSTIHVSRYTDHR